MKFPVCSELSTASVGSPQAPTDAAGSFAPSPTRSVSTYESGKAVQTNRATSIALVQMPIGQFSVTLDVVSLVAK